MGLDEPALFDLRQMGGPEEMHVDEEKEDQQGSYDPVSPSAATDGRTLQRVADNDEALHGDGDDQPDGIVADRGADDVDQLADPLGPVDDVVAGQLGHPETEKSDEQDDRVCVGQDGQVGVRWNSPHHLPVEDDEGQTVPDDADDEDDGRDV